MIIRHLSSVRHFDTKSVHIIIYKLYGRDFDKLGFRNIFILERALGQIAFGRIHEWLDI